jgi:hypothetical protein
MSGLLGGKNSIFRKPLGTGKKSVKAGLDKAAELGKQIVKEITKSTDKVIDGLKKEAENAAKKLTRTVEKTQKDISRKLTAAKEDIGKEVTAAKKHVDKEATKLKQDIDREATKAKRDIDKEAKRAKGKADKEATRLKKNIDREATKAKQNVDREATRLKGNLEAEATKGQQDIAKELTRAKKDVGEAVKVATRFVESELESAGKTLSESERKLREGKVLEAVWHLASQPVLDTKGAVAKSITESKLLSQVAATAATAYGGPAGAAAYSAWITYETTGSLDYAIKAGVTAGIASSGGAYANGLPQETINEQVKKELVKASVNAAAVAASGGTEEDIKKAFMKSANSSIKAGTDDAVRAWVDKEITPIAGKLEKPSLKEDERAKVIRKATVLAKDVDKFSKQWASLKTQADRLYTAQPSSKIVID